jgi:hypothetical protein
LVIYRVEFIARETLTRVNIVDDIDLGCC